MTRTRTCVVVTAATFLLSACSSTSASLDGPLLVSEGSWDDSMTALVGGEVSRVGSCIGLGDSMVVWPQGVSWDEDSEALTLGDGTVVELGEEVHGGGGSMGIGAVNSLFGDDAAQALKDCGVEVGSQVTVFNVGGDVETGSIEE